MITVGKLLLFFLLCCVVENSKGISNNILITGGAGFIGYHTAVKLAKDPNFKIVVLDVFDDTYDVQLKKSRAATLKEKGVIVHSGDVCSDQMLDHLFDKHHFDFIIHLAAKDGHASSMNDPSSFVRANTECLLVLLRTLSSRESTHLVFASSYNIMDENYKGLTPAISVYTALKTGAEKLVAAYCDTYHISAVGVCPYSVYGPWGRPDGDVYKMAMAIKDNAAVEIYTDEKSSTIASRDYTYIEDVVDGVIAAMNYRPSICGQVFDIGSGAEPVSMETVYSLLKQEMKSNSEKVTKSLPKYEPIQTKANIAKSKEVLGYNPKFSIELGIKEFVKWFKEHGSSKSWSSSEPDESLAADLKLNKVMYLNNKYKKRLAAIRQEYEKKAIARGLPVTKYYPKNFKKFGGYEANSIPRSRLTGKSISLLSDWCHIIDECVAFDSKGALHSFIPQQSNWKHSPGVDLYVADIDVCLAGFTTCYGNCTCTYKGPGQAENGCQKGYGLLKKDSQQDFCHELYVPGKPTQKEEEFKTLDWIENRDWNALVKNKPYVKFSKKYITYGVVAYYPDAAGNVDKLTAACNNTYHCIGFTTNGELKGIIDHVHRWKSSQYDMYLRDVDYCVMHEEKCNCKRVAAGNYSCQGRKP